MPSVFVMRAKREAHVRVTGTSVQALVAQGHPVDVTGVSAQVLVASATTVRVTGVAVQVLITGGG